MSNRMIRLLPALALTLAGAAAIEAQASGFMLREQSASALGNACAGVTAGAQDISSMYFNPAALGLYPGTQVSANASWIGIWMNLSDASASRAPVFQQAHQPISGPADLPNAVNQPILPAMYGSWSVTDAITLGLSVNAPYGLITDYPDDFIGRYHGLKTDLTTIDITPSVAVKFSKDFIVGVGLIARKCDAHITNAVDFGAIGNANGVPGFVPGGADALASLKGDCMAYGFKLGAIWQASQDLKVGLAYHGETTLKVDGKITYSSVPAVFASTFQNTGGKAEVDLPALGSLGFDYQVTPTFALQGEAAWTGWSSFKELRVQFDSPQPDSVTDESWKDVWFFSLGGVWKVNADWSVKAGVAYDQAPVGEGHRTPRIPDADRSWVSLGASWRTSPRTTFEFGYTRIFGKTSAIDLKSGNVPTADNFFRGNLKGSYEVGANIVSVGLTHRF